MIWIIDDAEKFQKKFKDVDVLDKKWTNIPVVINYMAKMHPLKKILRLEFLWQKSFHTKGKVGMKMALLI